MYLYEIICFSIFFTYFILIISYTYGFLRIRTFTPPRQTTVNNNLKISVLIPFKNEEMNLLIIIKNLKRQSLSEELFEVIFINDHSEDSSENVLKDLIKKSKNYRLISTEKEGKKQALKAGIENAENNLIVTSDADCFHPEKWLETIYEYYIKHHPKMIIAPVLLSGPEKLFYNMQKIEFLSLSASTAGAAGIKHPIMSNGANSAFEKDVFYEFKDTMNTEEISGDDVFLLHNIKKKYPKDIRYLKSTDAVVYTDAEVNFKSFLKQRIRWASKSKNYTDFDTITVSVIVFLTNLILAGFLFYSFFETRFLSILVVLFLIKIIPDFVLLSFSSIFFKQTKYLYLFPILSIIYPFYILFTGFAGFFVKNIKWK